ncbi:hypothetical protein LCGC14_1319280 [marine sediment metagenome]|uniref:Transglycosylase SLT domain-containing protein n=1 Tax=marine sediment metagenome TaxID=412755 RepID=A0A0F9KK04_9ZZZZ
MFRFPAALVVGLALSSLVPANSVVEVDPLTPIICAWETRGEADPDDAVGGDGELGRCQIKPPTARLLGYRGTNKALLSNGLLNEYWADRMVKRCRAKWKTPSDYLIFYCYNAGLRSKANRSRKAVRYAKQLLVWAKQRNP